MFQPWLTRIDVKGPLRSGNNNSSDCSDMEIFLSDLGDPWVS